MPFCANCGSPVEGRFCAKCGTSVDTGASAPPPQAQPAPAAPYQAPASAASAGMETNLASALCYVLGFVTGILFLALAPYNQNKAIRFHAFQSIFLSVGVIAVHIVLSMISTVLSVVSFTLVALFGMLHLLVSLGFFGIWLFMLWKTYSNEKVVLPVVGPLAEKQA